MIRACLFALDPTDTQVEAFRSHCGAQRLTYNWCLARVRANWEQRVAEETYGLFGDQLTPWISDSSYSLRKAWNKAKAQVAPWWRENSKEAYATGCDNLATALKNYKGRRAGTPRFKSKHRSHLSCRFTTGAFGLGTDRRHIKLPRIGSVRTHESTRKLARKIDAGTAHIRSATLSFQRSRWHVSFSVELPDPEPAPRKRGRVVGVDVGISNLAVLSTGEHVKNPRQINADLRRLRRAQRVCARRRGPDRRNHIEPSHRWLKARARANRIYTQVVEPRRDCLHKLTTRLAREFDTIVIEDLPVAEMLRDRRLARHIATAVTPAELRRQLNYKAADAGAQVVPAPRGFASSKTCSGCGVVKAKLALSERTYECAACGLVLDRDENAARNLAALAPNTGELRRELPDGSDMTGYRQSHRHGKSRSRLNAIFARRWLDE